MDIVVQLAFDEAAALRLLNWLASENARIFTVYDRRAKKRGEKSLPGLYESGVRYETEEGEIWRDPRNTVIYPGDGGYALAQRLKPKSIKAEVMLTSRTILGRPGLYHCIVRYWIGGKEFRDDPSARLGMLDDPDSAEVRQGLVPGRRQ